ncbi:MAG: BON domain-containing protein [Dehalococcoidia bacterium]
MADTCQSLDKHAEQAKEQDHLWDANWLKMLRERVDLSHLPGRRPDPAWYQVQEADWFKSLRDKVNPSDLQPWRSSPPWYQAAVPDRRWWKFLAAGAALGTVGTVLFLWMRRKANKAPDRDVDDEVDTLREFGKQAREGAAPGRGDAYQQRNANLADLDQVLIDRVETELFRLPGIPKGDLNLNAANGIITVRGTVRDRGLMQQILDEIQKVDGVRDVVNLMKTPEGASSV